MIPISDTHGRTHLYASGIAINYSAQKSAYTWLSEGILVTDADGVDQVIRGIMNCRRFSYSRTPILSTGVGMRVATPLLIWTTSWTVTLRTLLTAFNLRSFRSGGGGP